MWTRGKLKKKIIIKNCFQTFIFSCWLDFENGLIWAFAAPMACVLIVNTVMFIIAIRIAKKSIQKRGEDNEKTFALIKGKLLILITCSYLYRYIYLIKKMLLFFSSGSFSLLCILGITWIFGFMYWNDGMEAFAILFALLNSTQVKYPSTIC